MKLNKVALACSLGLCLSNVMISSVANAQQVTGQVKSSNGQPIANATLVVGNGKATITTDENGFFILKGINPGQIEIHTTAKNYSHEITHLSVDDNLKNIEILLNTSVMEVLDVYATPLHSSTIESAIPVSVLSGDDLKMKHASTLGETLKHEVGVHSSYYGPVSSSPIIRGLDGPRVLITQNGLDVSDASRVGPDHVVSTETSTATQIEVLRGPATLFYGSGAIGGVVNVVDNRVPTSTDTQFDYMLQHNTVANENEGSFNLNTGIDNFAFHLDAFARKSDDYSIPGHAELEEDHDEHEHDDEEENYGTLANSSSSASGFTAGTSYLLDNGFIGFSFGKMEREYGIPGHSHHHEEEHDVHEEGHDEHEDEHEEAVRGKLKQDRFQLLSDLNFENSFIDRLVSKLAYTAYQHQEIEGGEVGTQFNNDMFETRFDFYHQEVNGWKGAWTLHYKSNDFKATGEEAFTPPSVTKTIAAAWLEEKHYGDVLVQLGVRAEHVSLDATAVEDSHDEEGHHEDEHHDEEHSFKQQKFTPISASVGAVWDYAQGYNLGFSAAYSQRAPSASELFSKGAHIGTNTYEVGALYEIHQHDDHIHIELGDQNVSLETSYNLDLTWRKFEGDFGFVISAYYNHIDNYYYQRNSGFFADTHHDHDHEAPELTSDDALPIYIFEQQDAKLFGFETEFVYQVTDALKSTVFADYINAKLVDGDDLPRTPPMRVGASFDYQADKYAANLSIAHYFEQTNTAALETSTDSYTMVDANFNYYLEGLGDDFVIFAKVQNLTNEEARVHSSFLKNKTPLPGRGFSLGIRGSF